MTVSHRIPRTITGIFPVIFALAIIGLILWNLRQLSGGDPSGNLLLMGDNRRGQLATADTLATLHQMNFSGSIRMIRPGFDHTLLLTESGEVWGWGDNNYGQIGIGSNKGIISSPQKLALPPIREIAGGFRHSLALDASGTVWAWGDNTAGQLGDGTRTMQAIPIALTLPKPVIHITAGHRFSLATLTDGSVWAWGANCNLGASKTFEELMRLVGESAKGISYYVDADADPTEAKSSELCEFEGFVPVSSTVPREIPSLSGSQDMVAGFGHVLALQKDGSVTSVGCNAYGQVGRVQLEITPAEPIAELKHIRMIAASTRHSLALDGSGTVWAWGGNHMGQIGRDDRPDNIAPLRVSGLPSNIVSIAAGHDSSYALSSSGEVWGFGANTHEQMITNTGTYRLLQATPLHITGVRSMSANGGFVIFQK